MVDLLNHVQLLAHTYKSYKRASLIRNGVSHVVEKMLVCMDAGAKLTFPARLPIEFALMTLRT